MFKKFIDQTKFSTKDGTQKGNCFSACLASLMDLPIENVPNFAMMEEDTWYGNFLDFLEKYNHSYKGMFYFEQEGTWADLLKEYPEFGDTFIVGGKSPRDWITAGHAVIYKDNKLLHDPHFSREGILLLEYAYLIRKIA